jgi:programmed cell death protein 5
MDELEEIKKRRLKEFYDQQQRVYQEQMQQEAQLQQQIEQLEAIARNFLSKEALQRYGNLKIAHPDKAVQLLIIVAQAIQSGQIKQKINDNQLKEILRKLTPKKKEFKITKK